ncbi:hypothetical protein IWX49DRAFT_359744 [Phyllosticta citricarpa]
MGRRFGGPQHRLEKKKYFRFLLFSSILCLSIGGSRWPPFLPLTMAWGICLAACLEPFLSIPFSFPPRLPPFFQSATTRLDATATNGRSSTLSPFPSVDLDLTWSLLFSLPLPRLVRCTTPHRA